MKIKRVGLTSYLRFIVDANVGKLAKWLRMMGYDALFFNGKNDNSMITRALHEGRVILTKDSGIVKRRVVTSGQIKAMLVKGDEPESQIHQVIDSLDLNSQYKPFTICLECNHPLIMRDKQQVRDRVPPYIFKTQSQYMECPACHRIYWRGTHWQAMTQKLRKIYQEPG